MNLMESPELPATIWALESSDSLGVIHIESLVSIHEAVKSRDFRNGQQNCEQLGKGVTLFNFISFIDSNAMTQNVLLLLYM